MAFLIKADLDTVSTQEVINLITNTTDTIVETIIDESIDVMRSYLHRYYDVDAIFTAAGADRPKIVLKYLKDIVIYEIYTRRTREVNEVAKMRYDEAIMWLDKVAAGKLDPELPRLQTDEDGDGVDEPSAFMKLGSKKQYRNHF